MPSMYRSNRMIFKRLRKGPLWIEDYRSTGLKDRTDTHKRLKYLFEQGLITRRRSGHRILYELIDPATAFFKWFPDLFPQERGHRRADKQRLKRSMKGFDLFLKLVKAGQEYGNS